MGAKQDFKEGATVVQLHFQFDPRSNRGLRQDPCQIQRHVATFAPMTPIRVASVSMLTFSWSISQWQNAKSKTHF